MLRPDAHTLGTLCRSAGNRWLWSLVSLYGGIDRGHVAPLRLRSALVAAAQHVGGTRVGVLAIARVVSPLQRGLYRFTGGRFSLTGSAPVLLLTVTGRRTGRARTVPLFYVRDEAHFVVCNVNPGFERPNPWVVNLRAEPRARVLVRRSVFPVIARQASETELERLWPRFTRVWPAYQSFYSRGGARTVFILEPAPAPQDVDNQGSSTRDDHIIGDVACGRT